MERVRVVEDGQFAKLPDDRLHVTIIIMKRARIIYLVREPLGWFVCKFCNCVCFENYVCPFD